MSYSPCLIFHPPSYFTALAWHSTFSLLLGFLNVGTSVVVCGDHLRHPTRWTVPFHCHWAFPSVVVKWSTQWPVNRDVPAKLGLADAPTLLCLAPNWVKTSLLWKIGLHPHRPANTSSCPPRVMIVIIRQIMNNVSPNEPPGPLLDSMVPSFSTKPPGKLKRWERQHHHHLHQHHHHLNPYQHHHHNVILQK